MQEHEDERILSPDHQAWVADNLLAGCDLEDLVRTLAEQGVPKELAAEEVRLIAASGAFRRLLQANQRVAALEQVIRLRRDLEQSVDGDQITRVDTIEARAFFADYYAANRPLVITDAMANWPALTRWSPDYFAERYGHAEVDVCVGRSADPACDRNFAQHRQRMPLADYVSMMRAEHAPNDVYMISQNRTLEQPDFRGLLDDIRFLPMLDPSLVEGWMSLWLGPAGTVTPLHHDKNNILFCQVYGRKRFHLVSPLATALIEGLEGVYSRFDPEVDAPPESVFVRSVTLGPGDTLFIPVGYYHHVRALSASASLAFTGFRAPNHFRWYQPGAPG